MILSLGAGSACVRLSSAAAAGSVWTANLDVELPLVSLRLDPDADRVRPGAAVRLREASRPDLGLAPELDVGIGVVFALHADGSAVADFWGALGLRCTADVLEVVDRPTTAEHAVLRLLSECLAWAEISAAHGPSVGVSAGEADARL